MRRGEEDVPAGGLGDAGSSLELAAEAHGAANRPHQPRPGDAHPTTQAR